MKKTLIQIDTCTKISIYLIMRTIFTKKAILTTFTKIKTQKKTSLTNSKHHLAITTKSNYIRTLMKTLFYKNFLALRSITAMVCRPSRKQNTFKRCRICFFKTKNSKIHPHRRFHQAIYYVEARNFFNGSDYELFEMAQSVVLREKSRIGIAKQI